MELQSVTPFEIITGRHFLSPSSKTLLIFFLTILVHSFALVAASLRPVCGNCSDCDLRMTMNDKLAPVPGVP